MGKSPEQVVFLVHGIRDYALWQESIRKVLSPLFIVESTNYGRFDILRFLVPISYFRDKAIQRVWDQIRDVRRQYPDARYSFIAHSFGTYVLANILARNFDFTADRIVLCGSVLPYDFPFEQIADRFETPILNEVGTKDIWPALAESVTWGYGSAGTFGFRRPRVRDRWHAGATHGYFLSAEFCGKYWTPFFQSGEIVDAASEPEAPSIWLSFLSVVRLKYLAPLALLLVVGAVSQISSLGACYPYDPATDAPDKSRAARTCLPERLTYLKWADENKYEVTDSETGRWPNTRENRVLSAEYQEPDGTARWAERNLLRVDDFGNAFWQPPSEAAWREIVSRSPDVVSGRTGILLRRADEDCRVDTKRAYYMEAFIPTDIDADLASKKKTRMCFRRVELDCKAGFPVGVLNKDVPFPVCRGPIVRAAKDKSGWFSFTSSK